ncbi:MAG: tRNA-dihydrouridine synthase family protein [Polyangiaceae bacterium]|nr:tRNA-dihydrouridine synthase family protein [Polyangiaceae bacterium]
MLSTWLREKIGPPPSLFSHAQSAAIGPAEIFQTMSSFLRESAFLQESPQNTSPSPDTSRDTKRNASRLPSGAIAGLPFLALAPMQKITDLPFMRLIAEYGAPDFYFTEYFRVFPRSCLERPILRGITENTTGRPVFAQLMGEVPAELVRTARELQTYPIAGIDLNLGCPAPLIYKNNVGGGLLRDPDKIDSILGALRDAIPGLFTVKMRIGFDSLVNFERILSLINKHHVDLLSVHGRTVQEKYQSTVHYDKIAEAVQIVKCPLLANGNITSATKAVDVLQQTGAHGVMVGRHAIRNPWIFRQCREAFRGLPVTPITLEEVRGYIEKLYRATRHAHISDEANVHQTKRYLNFIGTSVDPNGTFLFEMRRAGTEAELFGICDRHLLKNPSAHFPLEPFSGLLARPTCEG